MRPIAAPADDELDDGSDPVGGVVAGQHQEHEQPDAPPRRPTATTTLPNVMRIRPAPERADPAARAATAKMSGGGHVRDRVADHQPGAPRSRRSKSANRPSCTPTRSATTGMLTSAGVFVSGSA